MEKKIDNNASRNLFLSMHLSHIVKALYIALQPESWSVFAEEVFAEAEWVVFLW